MRKKLLCLITFIIAMAAMFALADVAFAGTGDVVEYEVTGGSIYFDTSTGTITDCDTTVTKAEIPYYIYSVKVTSIGGSAFADCSVLTGVQIPNSVTSIGTSAFFRCRALTNLKIPTSVTSIGGQAFSLCSALKSIEIPKDVASIENYLFDGCSSLKNVVIPSSVTSVGNCAFRDCTSLASVALPSNVTNIGSYAFSGCSSLEEMKIPERVTCIEVRAFYDCSSLKKIELSDNVIAIESRAFYGCSSLEEITIPKGVTNIGRLGGYTFYGCSSLKSIEIPEGVTKIGRYTFWGCSALESIEMPSTVEIIEEYAFYGCKTISKFIIPDNVTSIGERAFYLCSSLKEIEIPNSVTSIGSTPFCGCSSLTEINVNTDNAVYQSIDGCLYNKQGTELIRCPEGKNGKVKVSNGTENIASHAFYNCSLLTDIEIAEGITSIGEYAFSGCSSLKEMRIPDGVSSIDFQTFYKCSSLNSVIIPQSVTSINNSSAFNGCSSLTEIIVDSDNSTYQSIDGCLYNKQGTELLRCPEGRSGNVTIANETEKIADYAFYNCSLLKSIETPSAMVSIGNYAFRGCSLMANIKLSECLESIGYNAFRYCSSLETIEIPESVTTINENPFYGCSKLKYIIVTENSYAKTHAIEENIEFRIKLVFSAYPVSTAIYGQKLSEVLLINSDSNVEGTWVWMDETQSVGNVSDSPKTFKAKFIPSDAETYVTIENIDISVTINPKALADDMIRISSVQNAYTGHAIDAKFTVYDGETFLIKGTDYKISSGESATSIENTTLVISGLGNYTGEATAIWILQKGEGKVTTKPTAAKSLIYNNSDQQLIITAGSGTGDMLFSLEKDGTYTSDITEITGNDAKTYIVWYKAAESDNYNESEAASIEVTITKADGKVIIEPTAASGLIYNNDAQQLITAVGNGTGDMVFSFEKDGTYTSDITTITGNDAKTYTVWYKTGESTNYNESAAASVEVTIAKASLSGIRAVGYNGRYDGYAHSITVKGVPTGATLTYSTDGENYTSDNPAYIDFTDGAKKVYYKVSMANYEDYIGSATVNIGENSSLVGLKYEVDGGYIYFNGNTGTITDCDTTVTKAEIPKEIAGIKVRSIGDYAFYNCSALEEITIPEGVTSIGKCAFCSCSSLEEIMIPDAVINIGCGAFSGCKSLKEIKIPEGVTSIEGDIYYDYGMFYNCTSLTKVELPDSLTSIGNYAFWKCNAMEEVKLPNDITSIGKCAFYNCSSLKEIALPEKVETIGYGAFSGCNSLKEIVIPEGVSSIEGSTNYDFGMFYNCTSLTKVELPKRLTSIGYGAFYGCSSLEEIMIPDRVTSIGNYAFSGCNSLTEITLPSSVTNIGDSAFSRCTGLIEFTLPEKVTNISDFVFLNCTSLSKITIPSEVTSIGKGAFSYCSSLTEITLPDKVTSIGSGAFCECNELLEFTIPNKVESIESGTFAYCTSLSKIVIPEGVKSIKDGIFEQGNGAFQSCTSLLNIQLPSTLISIGSSAFSDCSSLEELKIPVAVTNIGYGAFYRCTALKEIAIPNGVTGLESRNYYYNGVFYGCTSLTKIELPDRLTSIDDGTFYGCRSLKEIRIPDGVTSIGNSAFSSCRSLTEITLPSALKNIGGNAFYDCTSLKDITIPASVTSIGSGAFRYCSSLEQATLNCSIKSIAAEVFRDCSDLKQMSLPDGVTTIGISAFRDCSSMTQIYIPSSVKTIGNFAFDGCTSLNKIIGKTGSYAEQYAEDNNLEFQEKPHTHCVCGTVHKNIGDHTAENVITFTAWTDTLAAAQNGAGKTAANSLPTVAGNYYLTKDVTLADTWHPVGKTTLCLDGKNIVLASDVSVKGISLEPEALDDSPLEIHFALTDCSAVKGKIKVSDDSEVSQAISLFSDAKFDMYDGCIEGKESFEEYSAGISIGLKGDNTTEFYMYGGEISSFANGIQSSAKAYMYDGNITDCYHGIDNYIFDKQENCFYMSGGKITNAYMGISNSANFVMSGGSIEECERCIYNTAESYFTMSGGNIKNNLNSDEVGLILNYGDFKMSAGEITDNNSSNVVCNAGNFTMTGGSITNNTGTGLFTWNNTVIGGSAKITGNKLSDGSSSNLSIYEGTTINVTPLNNDAQIGISANTGVFIANAADEYIDRFFSDYPYCEIAADTEGKLKLQSKSGTGMPDNLKAPTVIAVYGQKLNDLTLENPSANVDGTWVWMDGTQSVGDASDTPKIFKAKFIPSDTDTYNTVEDIHVSVTVNPKPLTNDMLRVDSETKKYNGSAIEADFTVSDGEIPLVKDEDFNVDYSNNVNAGQATVNVNGIGNYSGTVTKHFEIEAADIKAWKDSVELEYTQVKYNGSAKTPAVTISGLTENVDFTVSYANNIEEGTAVVTISGIGNYTGEIQASFEILENVLCTVSGTAISWNNTDDAVYLLYAGTTEDSVIRTEWKDNSYGTSENVLNKDCTKGDVSANTDTKRWNQSFSFSGVSEGTYKLAILKPSHGIWIETISIDSSDIREKKIELYMYGDVNGDGKVKGADKMILARYLAKWEGYETLPVYEAVADLNCDGNIKGADKMILARYLAKWTGYETLPRI